MLKGSTVLICGQVNQIKAMYGVQKLLINCAEARSSGVLVGDGQKCGTNDRSTETYATCTSGPDMTVNSLIDWCTHAGAILASGGPKLRRSSIVSRSMNAPLAKRMATLVRMGLQRRVES